MRAKTHSSPPTHPQSSLLAHTCPHPNTLSKHTHICPDNSCFSVAHSHRQTMPSPPLPSPPCPLLHFSSHQLLSSPFLLCCGSSDRGILSLLMLPMGWRAQMKTMYSNGSAQLPQFLANAGGVHVEVRLHPVPPNDKVFAFAPEPLFRLLLRDPRRLPKAYSTPLLIHKAPPLRLTVAQELHAALLLEKWHGYGGVGGCEKGSFQKNPGLPLKHSHVKWQLPQPIPSLRGKREKYKLQKEVPKPTLLYPPTSTISPPILWQSLRPHSVCTSSCSSTAGTKMCNYCKTSRNYCATHFQPLGCDARTDRREHNSVLCVFWQRKDPCGYILPFIFLLRNLPKIMRNMKCGQTEFEKTISDQYGSQKSR